jgi:[ribosomal protein S5]-alanine N-acetyltransferase
MKHPFLIGRRIYLRGLEESDLEGDYFQWFNDADTCAYNSHARFPNTRQEMQDYFRRTQASRSEIVFAVVLKARDKHVGNVALQQVDWMGRSAMFSILIGAKGLHGKGIGKEAALLLRDYAFARLNLRRLHCGTHVDNQAMRKLALAMGMREEGRRVQAIFKNGGYHDIIEYGMVNDPKVGEKNRRSS